MISFNNQDDDQDQKLITVEEAIDCRKANSRYFNLINQSTQLGITVSQSSSIIGCQLDGSEIIVSEHLLQNHDLEAWAISEKALMKSCNLPWTCHVRGSELLFTIPNGSSVTYDMTNYNEVKTIFRLKTANIQNKVSYFNLRGANDLLPIDGHTILVQCNGNLNRIDVKETKLSRPHRSTILARSLIGDIPFQVTSDNSGQTQDNGETERNSKSQPNDIICDAIFSLEANSHLDHLSFQIQYSNRAVRIEVGSYYNRIETNQASVSSTSSRAKQNLVELGVNPRKASTLTESIQMNEPPQHEEPSGSNSRTGSKAISPNPDEMSTTLKVRVRITNFGICILPLMMKNYHCKYRFEW